MFQSRCNTHYVPFSKTGVRVVRDRARRARLKKAAAAAGIGLTLFHAGVNTALASVSSQMDVMWNTTAAHAYSTQTSAGVYAGNFSLRAPITSFQIFSFDPPHFDAGCGGIDMYLGSFSFISGDELKNLIRAIIQSAAGYLVHLAIKAICDPCESIMSKLEKIMQELNQGQMNTCKIAKQTVSTALNAAGITSLLGQQDPASLEINQNAVTIGGGCSDWMTCVSNVFSNGPTPVMQQAQSIAPSTGYGNIVVNSVFTTNALDSFSNTGIFGGDQGTIQMILSLFGTTIVQTQQDPSTSGGGPNSSLPNENYEPRLTFQDLLNGPGATPKPVYTCQDWADGSSNTCQTLSQSNDYSSFNFPGTQRYVVQSLAGDQSASGLLGADPNADRDIVVIQSGSVLGNMRAGTPLTAPQLTFVHAFPVGYQQLLLDANTSNSSTGLYNEIAQLMAEDLAVSLAEGLERVITIAFVPGSQSNQSGAKTSTPMPAQVAAARKQFATDMVAYEGKTSKDRLARIQALVAALKTEHQLSGTQPVAAGK